MAVSSWDTNPTGNFCDHHWDVICRNKWHLGILETSTLPEIAKGTHLHALYDTKTIPVFLTPDGEAT